MELAAQTSRFPSAKRFRTPDEREQAALGDLVLRLRADDSPDDAEGLQNLVFEIGKSHEFDPLRDWFKALYQTLLGQDQGPRFGSFVALYGKEATANLIDRALAGDLVAPAGH